MAFEFKLPDIGEGVIEGEVVRWKVAEGDALTLDQPMVEVMTDKATVEIPAPAAGRVARILVPEGKVCKVGEVLIVIEDGSAPQPALPRATLATPATRRLARELGVNLSDARATGNAGRVTSEDVRRQAARANGGSEERIPFRGLRKAIAQNLVRSTQTAAHFTYVEEIDVTDLVALRTRAKDKAAERGTKLSYLPFIIKAVLAGLKKWPSLNASLDEANDEIVLKHYYHIGIAAQGPQGLSVGVLRDADQKSILDLSREVARLAEAIRTGKADREDLVGSTFTISSLGQLGGLMATPIINHPESAILGVHKIVERPTVRGGQIVIRQLMNLSISVDHRIADGYDAAMFVQEVKAGLEDPTQMFLAMV